MTVMLPPGHRPSKVNQSGGPQTIQNQRDNRYLDCFYDQHKFGNRFPNGRPWSGYREHASERGFPDGFCQVDLFKGDWEDPFNAQTNWSAPWVPEMNGGRQPFYEFDYPRKRIRIRYDHVIIHDTQGLERYYAAAAKLSGANGWGAIRFGVTPTYQVTSLIGMPPRSPKIAQAAQAGDKWLLGFIEEPNEELAKLLGLSSSGFQMPQPEGVISPETVLTLSEKELNARIDAAVEAALKRASAVKKGGKATAEQDAA